jgi:holo-[acyl-carrier protein] synthase
MIKGIGVDIIEISRIQDSLDRLGSSFTRKIFTEQEVQYCSSKAHPAQHYAARFAAKEAMSKALATGWAGDFQWKNVEVVNALSGKPEIVLHGRTKETMAGNAIHLTISHSDTSVVAFVVIESTLKG